MLARNKERQRTTERPHCVSKRNEPFLKQENKKTHKKEDFYFVFKDTKHLITTRCCSLPFCCSASLFKKKNHNFLFFCFLVCLLEEEQHQWCYSRRGVVSNGTSVLFRERMVRRIPRWCCSSSNLKNRSVVRNYRNYRNYSSVFFLERTILLVLFQTRCFVLLFLSLKKVLFKTLFVRRRASSFGTRRTTRTTPKEQGLVRCIFVSFAAFKNR